MAATSLRVQITGDVSGLRKALGQASSDSGSFGSKMTSWATRITGAVAGAFAVDRIKDWGGQLVNAAVQVDSLGQKSKIVFGDQLGVVQKWANQAAAGMGLTAKQATGLAAGFRDLLVPMGFTRQEAAKMSTDVIGLSGALSEWSGGTRSAAEVADILSAAMLGERDALQGLGISISQAEVDAQMLINKQKGLKFATDEQAAAVATQQLIFAKSKDAQDAYAKSSDDLASKTASLKATFGTVKEQIVSALVPALSNLATWAKDNLPKALDAIRAWWDGSGKNVVQNLKNAWEGIKLAFKDVKDLVSPLLNGLSALGGQAEKTTVSAQTFRVGVLAVTGALIAMGVQSTIAGAKAAAAWVVALGPVGWATAAIIAVASLVIANWDKIANWTRERWTQARDWAVNTANDLRNRVSGTISGLVDGIGRTWAGIQERFRAPVEWVLNRVINPFIRGLNRIPGINLPVIGFNMGGAVPRFATGGTVPGVGNSDSVPAMLTPGEFVLSKPAVQALGLATVERLHQTARRKSGRLAIVEAIGADGVAHFAEGGLVGWLGGLVGGARNAVMGPLGQMGSRFGPVGSMFAGAVREVLDVGRVAKALLDKVGGAIGGFVGSIGGAGVERWRSLVLTALSIVGQPAAYANITLRRMNQESGGNPRAINLWDINARRGIPSKGLMQVIDPTFRAYRHPGLPNDVWNPLANVVASMRYALARYGSLPAAYNRRGGYRLGGLVLDRGGVLPPGASVVLNNTGGPEHLTRTDDLGPYLGQLVDFLERRGSGVTIHIHGVDPAQMARRAALEARFA